jgi:putative SOS response-associated peptidase YedK
MCGRYNLITDASALIDFFEIDQSLLDETALQPRYNIAPNQEVPIVRQTGAGRELAFARWGLVPHWSKEEKPKYSTINARAESVAEKPAYRKAFKHKRCLIPATGFYEWQKRGEKKLPHHIRQPGGGLFAFAGLWDHWEKQGPGFDSCSIIVTGANAGMQPIHERMPVILNPAQYNVWLNTGHFNRAQLEALLAPYGGKLETCPISNYVNNPKHDDAQCIDKAKGT